MIHDLAIRTLFPLLEDTESLKDQIGKKSTAITEVKKIDKQEEAEIQKIREKYDKLRKKVKHVDDPLDNVQQYKLHQEKRLWELVKKERDELYDSNAHREVRKELIRRASQLFAVEIVESFLKEGEDTEEFKLCDRGEDIVKNVSFDIRILHDAMSILENSGWKVKLSSRDVGSGGAPGSHDCTNYTLTES
jgi:septal ring factor EnvC (AmiA/AmiB activator)